MTLKKWHCSRNGHRSSGLEPSNASGALMWVWVGAGGAGRGVLTEFCPANINACTSWSKMLLVLARFVLDGGVAQMSEPEWLGWPSVHSSLVCSSSTCGRN